MSCVFRWQTLFYVFENFLNQGNKTWNKLLLCLPGAVHINILTHQRSQINNSDSNANRRHRISSETVGGRVSLFYLVLEMCRLQRVVFWIPVINLSNYENVTYLSGSQGGGGR